MNKNKEKFKEWITTNLAKDSGAVSSYIASLEWLTNKFYANNKIKVHSIFDIEDPDIIEALYKEAKQLQRDKDSYIYNKDAPSYGNRFYYSASLSKYKEFLLFKNYNKQPVLEKFRINLFGECIFESGLRFSEKLIARFSSSLLTKPFVILTGLSGSGKTKLAQIFTKWICEKETQYKIIPVGADWTNREPLLGYPNALQCGEYVMPESEVLNLILEASKTENQNKPYFLILDEMNLSHVERYFADFLSAMESGESIPLHSPDNWKDDVPSQINLPKNLFIIGTVNIDETTYMFSPKVLDRANVIEFRVSESEMKQYLDNIKPLNLEEIKGQGKEMAASFVEMANDKSLKPLDSDNLNTTLLDFFKELKKTGAEFGYRSASEIHRFVAVANQLDPTWKMDEIIDCAIMQKLLPKVHGSRRKLEPVLKTLGALCLADGIKIEDIFNRKTEIELNVTEIAKYPISLEKVDRMYKRLLENGFTSYAEA